MKKSLWIFSLVCIAFSLFIGCAQEEVDFPSKQITLLVPWDAGGGTDALARSIADEAQDIFGVAVNVVNRSGGSGTVGHNAGATARPDGYTVTMITYELVTFKPLSLIDLGVDDFEAVVQLNEDPGAITVHSESQWSSLKEFVDYSVNNPGKVTVGNSGPGAVWHLGAVKLEQLTGAEFSHIPHNGAKPAVTQLVGQHLDAVAVSPAEVLQYVQTGTLRCLGIMSEERDPQLPDVPICQEQGFDLVHGTWRGLAVPQGTPGDIVDTLEQGFKQAYESKAFQTTAKNALLGLKYRSSEAFETFLQNEANSATELIEALNLEE